MSALFVRGRIALAAIAVGLGAAAPAGAQTIGVPANLRPVQNKLDCAFVSSAAMAACDVAVRAGDLQLLWDETAKTLDGYKIYRVDAKRHVLVQRTSDGSAPAYAHIPKPHDGYLGKCYAVEAYLGKVDSADSAQYCVTSGAPAAVKTLAPDRLASLVHWSVPTLYQACRGAQRANVMRPAQIFALTQPAGFTALIPWLAAFGNPQLVGSTRQAGVAYAGAQAYGLVTSPATGFAPYCPAAENTFAGFAAVSARTGLDFNLQRLSGRKVYSATLMLDPAQALRVSSRKFVGTNDFSCATSLAVALDAWWRAGQMPFHQTGQATFGLANVPTVTLDVTPIVSSWAANGDRDDYGFILRSGLEDGRPTDSFACMTQYTNPRLNVVYF